MKILNVLSVLRLITVKVSLLLVFLSAAHAANSETIIRITDNVLVPDTQPLGVHFTGNNYYNSAILKERLGENFEGTIDRLHVMGPADQPDPEGIFLWNLGYARQTKWVGAKALVLAGPDQWKEVTVTGLEERVYTGKQRGVPENTCFVRFSEPVTWTGENYIAGILLDRSDLSQGQMPWLRQDGRFDSNYGSEERLSIVTDGTPPEVGQNAALKLQGAEEEAWVRFRAQFYQPYPWNGDWKLSFWAKAAAGEPTLIAKPTVPGEEFQPELTGEWKRYEAILHIDPPTKPENNPILMFDFRVRGGDVLIDVIQAEKVGDSENPTPFRDILVDVFKELNPGSVRLLRNSRDTVYNQILPDIMDASTEGVYGKSTGFGTHEFNEFCAHIGANPWATLSGTCTPKDVADFIEYHAAPADKGLGILRAQLGHPTPWTEVFEKIYIQFGNEVLTFRGTGYWGPDYWQGLIDIAKASPYFDEDKFEFIVNEQGGGPSLMKQHPGFDMFTINSYLILALYEEQVQRAGDTPGFYDWVYASNWHIWMDMRHNKWSESLKIAKELGKEICIYEGGNYHTTFSSDTPDQPIDKINKMMAGYAGGVSAINSQLILLKHHGARLQQNFNLSQESFMPAGAFGNLNEPIRGWGGVLRIGNEQSRRYRPRFLALKLANEVIGGDLMETVHEGEDPKFSVTNLFGSGYGPSRKPKEMTVSDIPRINSYAFAEGSRRGLILVSADPRQTQQILLELDAAPQDKKARGWLLTADDLEATNEHDWSPEQPSVTISEQELVNFQSGYRIALPPGAMMAIEWNTAAEL